jgi:hypothetical protein
MGHGSGYVQRPAPSLDSPDSIAQAAGVRVRRPSDVDPRAAPEAAIELLFPPACLMFTDDDHSQSGRPDLMSMFQKQRILVVAVLLCLAGIRSGRAAEGAVPVAAPDPVFASGLATLKQAAGLVEERGLSTDWKPNLQLLVGVKAVEGLKSTIYFVQLTTLAPPTHAAGQPWQPVLRTNDFAWSSSNKARFVSALYPVRVRIFDGTGRQLKEGQTPMAWGMLTNGLMDLCRLAFERQPHNRRTNAPASLRAGEEKTAGPRSADESEAVATEVNEEVARATGGGFLWMFAMMYDLQTVPAVAGIWEKAQCAIRWPGAWTLLKSFVNGITLTLEPRLKEVTLAGAASAGDAGALYRLPVDLTSSKRHLTRVEILVGPAHGAEMLLAGIRSIHAAHPSRPKQEFLAQVLAAGTVVEPE